MKRTVRRKKELLFTDRMKKRKHGQEAKELGKSRRKQEQKPEIQKKGSRRSDKAAASERKMRRLVGLLILPFAVVLLIAAAFFSGNLLRGEKMVTAFQESPAAAVTSAVHATVPPDTKEYIMNFGGSILQKDAVPEIQKLMEEYFRSITDCDMNTFLGLFTSKDTSEEEKYRGIFEKQREYIESYQNINCYTVKGLDDHSWVVYVSYDVKFVGVDTLGPDLVRIYAVKGDDGQYRIYDEPMTPELEAFLDQVAGNEDVRLLISQVDHQAEEAMSEDEELKKRITYLKNGPPYMQQDGTASEASQDTGETQTEAGS